MPELSLVKDRVTAIIMAVFLVLIFIAAIYLFRLGDFPTQLKKLTTMFLGTDSEHFVANMKPGVTTSDKITKSVIIPVDNKKEADKVISKLKSPRASAILEDNNPGAGTTKLTVRPVAGFTPPTGYKLVPTDAKGVSDAN